MESGHLLYEQIDVHYSLPRSEEVTGACTAEKNQVSEADFRQKIHCLIPTLGYHTCVIAPFASLGSQ